METKPIMINKGSELLCIETLHLAGKLYFKKGKTYLSPEDNCLTNEWGENNFVQEHYLKHFDFESLNVVKEDMICPVLKKQCDDECCSVGSICNMSNYTNNPQAPQDPPAPQDVHKSIMTKKMAIIIRSLRVSSKFSYSTISELLWDDPNYEVAQKACKEAKEHFPDDSDDIWNKVEF